MAVGGRVGGWDGSGWVGWAGHTSHRPRCGQGQVVATHSASPQSHWPHHRQAGPWHLTAPAHCTRAHRTRRPGNRARRVAADRLLCSACPLKAETHAVESRGAHLPAARRPSVSPSTPAAAGRGLPCTQQHVGRQHGGGEGGEDMSISREGAALPTAGTQQGRQAGR